MSKVNARAIRIGKTTMPNSQKSTNSKKTPPASEPEPEEPEESEELTEEEMKKKSATRRLLNAKKRQSGYRLRALKSGSRKYILGRLFSAEDIRRMGKFAPSGEVLSYQPEEYCDRAVLSATPFPASAAFALVPSVDALARHIVTNATVASYTAGRPSATPWDIYTASREIIASLDFTPTFPEGLIEYGQLHDSRGEPVTGRSSSENVRFPILPYGEEDSDIVKTRNGMQKECAEMMAKVLPPVKSSNKAEPAAVVPVSKKIKKKKTK